MNVRASDVPIRGWLVALRACFVRARGWLVPMSRWLEGLAVALASICARLARPICSLASVLVRLAPLDLGEKLGEGGSFIGLSWSNLSLSTSYLRIAAS